MKSLVYLCVACMCMVAACTPPYKKTGEGSEYKIISAGNNEKIQYGNHIEFHLKQFYRDDKFDTLLADTKEYMPRFELFDSSAIPPEYIEILNKAGKDDSVVIRVAVDSLYKLRPELMPHFMQKGGYKYTTIKILDVFANEYIADSVERVEFRKNELKIYEKKLAEFEKEIEINTLQIEIDSKIIKSYLDKNNIKYIRGKWGTFISISDSGLGGKIKYNNVVAVNYTGKTFESGDVFGSNLDPEFDDRGPYEVTMSKPGNVLPGWTDALMELNDGARATIYIPSPLAYGKKGFLPKVKPNDVVVFEINVIKMLTEVEAMEIASKNRLRAKQQNEKILEKERMKNLSPFQTGK